MSCRGTTGFATPLEELLDLAREVSTVLLTAQQRARQGKTELRFGEGKWWTEKKRWGGGPGGPIGREVDKIEVVGIGEKIEEGVKSEQALPSRAAVIGGISGPSPLKRPKRSGGDGKSGTMGIYDNYRKLNPPASTWDRKARYEAIGKIPGAAYDDVFLVSSLNHHISIVRVRVPERLLDTLDGHEGEGWGRMMMWRSRWYDLFLAKERIEAMQIVWGMMGYLMRKIEEPASSATPKEEKGAAKEEASKMDVD